MCTNTQSISFCRKKRLFKRQIPNPHIFKGSQILLGLKETVGSQGVPIAMVLVIFSGRVHDRAGLHADLLEEVPHFLINVLLEEGKRHHYHAVPTPESPSSEHRKGPCIVSRRESS